MLYKLVWWAQMYDIFLCSKPNKPDHPQVITCHPNSLGFPRGLGSWFPQLAGFKGHPGTEPAEKTMALQLQICSLKGQTLTLLGNTKGPLQCPFGSLWGISSCWVIFQVVGHTTFQLGGKSMQVFAAENEDKTPDPSFCWNTLHHPFMVREDGLSPCLGMR